MPKYIAMLRGVNVSGHKPLPMAELRASLARLGFTGIKTYLQSGNAVFETRAASPRTIASSIEQIISKDFGYAVPVLVRSAADWKALTEANPFCKVPALDASKFHVTFLAEPAEKTATALLRPLITGPEQFHVLSSEIYLYCPNGYGRTRLSNTAIEKKLSARATTRNWKTVMALAAMME